MKKTSASSGMPPTPITASTSGPRRAISWSATAIASSPIRTVPSCLYESGFAPRWYVPRDDIEKAELESVEGQTFCPYKGLADYYNIGDRKRAAWSYVNAWPEVGRVSNLVSFEPDKIDVWLDGQRLHLEPGQSVVPHGIDRGLDPDEILQNTARSAS